MRGEVAPPAFDAWIRWKLGARITEEYMLPYNRKMWSLPSAQLGTYWLYKLPSVSFRETLRSWWKETGYEKADGTPLAPGEGFYRHLDASGNGFHLTQPDDSAYYPTYEAGVLGGRPVARYAHSCIYNTAIAFSLQRFTIIDVVRSTAASSQNYGRIASLGLPAGDYDYNVPNGLTLTADNTGDFEYRANSGNSNFNLSLTSAQMGGRPMPWSVVSLRAGAGVYTISRGGFVSASASQGYSTTATGLCSGVVWYNGAPYYSTSDGVFYGDRAERVIFDYPLAQGALDFVIALLTAKWSVPVLG